jgi:hypothetical protein
MNLRQNNENKENTEGSEAMKQGLAWRPNE